MIHQTDPAPLPAPGLSRRRILATGAAAAVLPVGAAAQSPRRLVHGYAAGTAADRSARHFADLVRGLTGTRLVVEAAAAIPSSRTFQSFRSGEFAAWMGRSAVQRDMPELQVFNVPFLIRNEEHFQRVLTEAVDGPVGALFNRQGLTLVSPIATGAHVFSSSHRPIEHPGDLKGLKTSVRSGTVTALAFRELGAATVTVPGSEVFAASSSGFLDAVASSISQMKLRRLYEAHRYLSLTRHVHGVAFLVVDDALARDLGRRGLRDLGRRMADFSFNAAADQDRRDLDILQRNGMDIVDVAPEEFEYVKKLTYDIVLSEARNAWDVLNFIEDLAF